MILEDDVERHIDRVDDTRLDPAATIIFRSISRGSETRVSTKDSQ